MNDFCGIDGGGSVRLFHRFVGLAGSVRVIAPTLSQKARSLTGAGFLHGMVTTLR